MYSGKGHTFVVRVVGCKVNQVEADMLAALLEAGGWRQVSKGEVPDLVLVHTCTVTQRADRDSKRFIIQAQKQYPGVAIAVSGCLAELEKEMLADLPGVIAVIDQAHRSQIAKVINQAFLYSERSVTLASQPKVGTGEEGFFSSSAVIGTRSRSRAMIKIEDGCDGMCTYCRVRLARGKPVSRPLTDILSEARMLIQNGFQELVLTGVNIGCWQPGLPKLISSLAALPGKFRLRLSSIEPQHLSDELIQTIGQVGERICPHLHLPLQSGDDVILRAMRRTYTVQQFKQQVDRLRAVRPDIVLTGDVIVGFPGESREAFANSCKLVQESNMIRLHVFPFSARPGTEAANLPGQLVSREITTRAKELRNLGKALAHAYRQSRVGTRTTVLIEEDQGGNVWSGTTETYDRAHIIGAGRAGELVEGYVTGIAGEILLVNSDFALA